MDTEKKEAQVQNQDLIKLRSRIDQIDREIVRLYEERMQVTDEVGEFKIRTGRKVYDKDRERAKIETVKGLAHSDFTRKGVAELFSQLMSMSRKRQFAMLEKAGFEDIVLSMKSSDVKLTIDAYRLAHERCDYPLHLGVTEAGLPGQGTVKSAIGIGALLADGIGDTIRVSLSGDPLPEAKAAWDILRALNMRTRGVQLIACPTCGRTCIPVADIARRVETELADVTKPLKVAVMGCIVNGIGEGREADVGIAGGKDGGALFVKGQEPRRVQGDLAEIMIAEVRKILAEA